MSNEIVEILLTAGLATQESSRNLNRDIKNLEKNNIGKLNLNVGINKESIANLKKQIDAIHTSLPKLNVSLNVNASTASATSAIGNMDKQTTALISKFDELIEKLTKVADPPPKKKTPKILGGIQDDVINTMSSLKELESYLKGQGYSIDVKFSVDKNGREKVQHVLAQIKNEMGQLETLKIKPTIDQKTGESTFRLYGSGNSDREQLNFIKNQNQAYEILGKIEKQGKLTTKQLDEYNKRVANAKGNTELEEELRLLKLINQQRGTDIKIGSGNSKIRNETRDAIQDLEKLKQASSSIGLDTSQYDKLINRMKTLSNIDITNEQQLIKAERIFSKLSSKMKDLKNDTSTFSTSFNTLNTILDTVSRSGLMSAEALDKIRNRITLLNASDLTMDEKVRKLKNEIIRLNEELGSTKHTNKMTEGMQKARNEVAKLEAQLLKTINSYKRTVNMDLANSIGGQLNGMKNIPQFENTAQTKKYMADLKAIEIQIRNLNAQATVGARNSMSVIDSFKVAMEKFPIWMLSSTLFFGAIRTGKEFIDILVDIDTKLVNISKVMSDDTDMSKVFDDATRSAETFAQSISSVLDAYAEFARQGYKGQDMQLMGEAALVAGNVGEITPEKAAEYLTSATIQWGKSTSDAMGIIDSFNNISNNYATTLVKLAEGHTRVASIAKAMNVDFHELNAMIGTI